jgi:hypothetical protein
MNRILWPNFGGEEGLPPSGPGQAERFVGEGRLARAFSALFAEGAAFADASGFIAWFNNTPAAIAAKQAHLPLFGSSPDVVAVVHDKAFVARAQTSAAVTVVDAQEVSLETLQAARIAAGPTAVIKPRLSTSGRGRIAASQPLSPRTIARMRQQGGCVVEPWLQRSMDLSSLWRIHPDRIELLAQTTTDVDSAGVFRGSQLVRTKEGWRAGSEWDRQLERVSAAFVDEAARAGLRGPCGVDAFVHHGPDGQAPAQLRVCELNARFTVGMIAAAHAHASTENHCKFSMREEVK